MTEILFPEVIDNTMRKELIKCHKAAHYRFEMGLEAPDAAKVDLVAGGAFAAGLEAARKAYYVDGLSAKKAVEKGVAAVSVKYGSFVPDKATSKTVQRMAGALAFYFTEHPLDEEKLKPIKLLNGYAIEMQFNEELPILHPTSNQSLRYAGRFDMLAMDSQGQAWVVDEKTTSQMGEKWANQWFLDSQITGYCWGARKLLDANGFQSVEVAGAVINGVAIRKYDYECQRLQQFREDWEIERWYNQMLHDVQQWKRAFMAQDHSMALDHACAYYLSPCQFTPLCKSRNPERLIDGSFVIRRWNPTERD
jgi:hypothetical protein